MASGLGSVRLSVRRVLHENRLMDARFGYRHVGHGVVTSCPGAASEMLEKHRASACWSHGGAERTTAMLPGKPVWALGVGGL